MLQRGGLSKTRVYLDNCSTVTGFTDARHIKDLEKVEEGSALKVHCNAGDVATNKVGKWGRMRAWHLPDSIANILSQSELERHYRVTYDSWEGYYVVHTEHGPIKFHKDENGLPFIELDDSEDSAAVLFVQTVHQKYEGFTKKENGEWEHNAKLSRQRL